jgi:hypothetical protein
MCLLYMFVIIEYSNNGFYFIGQIDGSNKFYDYVKRYIGLLDKVYEINNMDVIDIKKHYSPGKYLLHNYHKIICFDKDNEGVIKNLVKYKLIGQKQKDISKKISFDKLDEFNIKDVHNAKSFLIMGNKRLEKETLISNILGEFKNFPKKIVSPSYLFFGNYKQIPNTTLYNDIKSYYEIGYNANNMAEVIIFDDAIKNINNMVLDELISNGRKYNKIVMVSAEYMLNIRFDLRTKFDRIFLFYDHFVENKKDFCDVFSLFDESIGQFKSSNSCCLVLDNTCVSNNLYDKVKIHFLD